MAIENLLSTGRGFEVSLDSGEVVYIDIPLSSNPNDPGLPAEDLATLATAKLGSKATDLSNGDRYTLKPDGGGGSTWLKDVTQDDLVGLGATEMAWKEPVVVKDDTVHASLAAAEAAVNTGTVGTVAVGDTSRILFTSISGQPKGAYVVVGAPPAATLTVPNAPKDNDVIRVKEGANPAVGYFYNAVTGNFEATGPTQADIDVATAAAAAAQTTADTAQTEAGTAQTTADDAQTDATAAGVTAAAAGVAAAAAQTSADNAQAELDLTQAALGPTVDAAGNYVARIGSDYLDGNTSITEDVDDVAAQVKINSDALANAGTGNPTSTSALSVTAAAVIDSANVDAVAAALWDVTVRQGAVIRGFLVHAGHTGTTGADATNLDYGTSLRLKKGGNIPGLDLDVVLAGAGVAQTMDLVVSSAGPVDVYVTRTDVPF
jgi:hypothetical protein